MTLVSETSERVLKVIDRCDRCDAQAFVLVSLINGELMFCGHHYNKYSNSLNKSAYKVVDERDQINKKSESSN